MASSGYTAITFVASEQPTTAKWNLIGSNDASFNNGNGFEDSIIIHRHIGGANMVVQEQCYIDNALKTGTTLIPYDDTIPQSSEGNEFMTASFTPKSATNILIIEASPDFYTNSNLGNAGVALFKDSDSSALASISVAMAAGGNSLGVVPVLRHKMVAGTTSAITFRVRIGNQIAGTITFNGIGGTRYFGGTINSTIKITETRP